MARAHFPPLKRKLAEGGGLTSEETGSPQTCGSKSVSARGLTDPPEATCEFPSLPLNLRDGVLAELFRVFMSYL